MHGRRIVWMSARLTIVFGGATGRCSLSRATGVRGPRFGSRVFRELLQAIGHSLEQMVRYIIADRFTDCDSARRVELPVDSQVDAALGILLGGLAEARVVARDSGKLIGR